ncbi:MAG TPA: hypothetical protein VJO35_01545 [Terriglobales bacterium]|nr:hypothetical protein [Terriglobales bacterium]
MIITMRRIAAHLALAAIYAGFFAPLLVSEQTSLHACCLRSGAHHCLGASSEAGFHAKNTACPYAAQFPPTTSFGLEASEFSISSAATAALPVARDSRSCSQIAVRLLSARAPPNHLL